ncbi:Yip1 family protein [Polaromonas sp.]|uniref:Yip1 family protein n=1 Tax=Polaromonas sp. TaxID=1869339 RepID=UPI0024881B92|nr:Yip1 family protein [Polaromonas sp.]MDI1274489.1 Yip1 family protein [Polaromonas sp.]
MNVLQIPRMIFSFSEGWDDLIRFHPSIARLFALVVLPLSLLPPAMIYYAGGSYGEVFVRGVTPEQWHVAAGIFFLAELLTVPIMAWLIHLVARANNMTTDYHACFTLAAIAPVPLWISSLTLFVPSLAVGVVVGALGLLCSVGLIYRGVFALFSMREDVKAFQMATVIAGAGLFMWLILMQIVLIR